MNISRKQNVRDVAREVVAAMSEADETQLVISLKGKPSRFLFHANKC